MRHASAGFWKNRNKKRFIVQMNRFLTIAPGEVWRGCETSPFSIKFGGMYGKLAFFGSNH